MRPFRERRRRLDSKQGKAQEDAIMVENAGGAADSAPNFGAAQTQSISLPRRRGRLGWRLSVRQATWRLPRHRAAMSRVLVW